MNESRTGTARSIGLTGLLRFLVAAGAVVALGAAVSADRLPLAATAGVALSVMVALGVLAYRQRRRDGWDSAARPRRPD